MDSHRHNLRPSSRKLGDADDVSLKRASNRHATEGRYAEKHGAKADAPGKRRNKKADPAEYIHLLEERNRLLKRLKTKNATKYENYLKQREKSFELYLGGANEDRVNNQIKKAHAAGKTRPGAFPTERALYTEEKKTRKTWGAVDTNSREVDDFDDGYDGAELREIERSLYDIDKSLDTPQARESLQLFSERQGGRGRWGQAEEYKVDDNSGQSSPSPPRELPYAGRSSSPEPPSGRTLEDSSGSRDGVPRGADNRRFGPVVASAERYENDFEEDDGATKPSNELRSTLLRASDFSFLRQSLQLHRDSPKRGSARTLSESIASERSGLREGEGASGVSLHPASDSDVDSDVDDVGNLDSADEIAEIGGMVAERDSLGSLSSDEIPEDVSTAPGADIPDVDESLISQSIPEASGRQLSARRRSVDPTKEDSWDDAQSVIEALREENARVGSARPSSRSSVSSQRSVPCAFKRTGRPMFPISRPSSALSTASEANAHLGSPDKDSDASDQRTKLSLSLGAQQSASMHSKTRDSKVRTSKMSDSRDVSRRAPGEKPPAKPQSPFPTTPRDAMEPKANPPPEGLPGIRQPNTSSDVASVHAASSGSPKSPCVSEEINGQRALQTTATGVGLESSMQGGSEKRPAADLSMDVGKGSGSGGVKVLETRGGRQEELSVRVSASGTLPPTPASSRAVDAQPASPKVLDLITKRLLALDEAQQRKMLQLLERLENDDASTLTASSMLQSLQNIQKSSKLPLRSDVEPSPHAHPPSASPVRKDAVPMTQSAPKEEENFIGMIRAEAASGVLKPEATESPLPANRRRSVGRRRSSLVDDSSAVKNSRRAGARVGAGVGVEVSDGVPAEPQPQSTLGRRARGPSPVAMEASGKTSGKTAGKAQGPVQGPPGANARPMQGQVGKAGERSSGPSGGSIDILDEFTKNYEFGLGAPRASPSPPTDDDDGPLLSAHQFADDDCLRRSLECLQMFDVHHRGRMPDARPATSEDAAAPAGSSTSNVPNPLEQHSSPAEGSARRRSLSGSQRASPEPTRVDTTPAPAATAAAAAAAAAAEDTVHRDTHSDDAIDAHTNTLGHGDISTQAHTYGLLSSLAPFVHGGSGGSSSTGPVLGLKPDEWRGDEGLGPDSLSMEEIEKLLREHGLSNSVVDWDVHGGHASILREDAPGSVGADTSQSYDIDDLLVTKVPCTSMPQGSSLRFEILSTWGDRYYVGLSAVEIFDKHGLPVRIRNPDKQVTANPPDINVLPDYHDDPRTVKNLFDGVCATCDDLHVWLAPFTPGVAHTISIEFPKKQTISCIRIWNYNKNRPHSFRGARHVVVYLDGTTIFSGEIKKAPGSLAGVEEAAERIFFTQDSAIIQKLTAPTTRFAPREVEARPATLLRPPTPTGSMTNDELEAELAALDMQTRERGSDGRPFTAAVGRELGVGLKKPQAAPATTKPVVPSKKRASVTAPKAYRGKRIKFNFTSTWGDRYYLGLCGIEVMCLMADSKATTLPSGSSREVLPEHLQSILMRATVDSSLLYASPRDLNEIPGYSGDDRTPDKLFDDGNVTCDDHHMWLVPFTRGGDHILEAEFDAPLDVIGAVFWNYNKSVDDSSRGARAVQIFVDDVEVTPPYGALLRKAPGCCDFNFGQCVIFGDLAEENALAERMAEKVFEHRGASAVVDAIPQYYTTLQYPTGAVFKFVLLSTWGDLHYVGLNGIELYDCDGELIDILDSGAYAAQPDSVRALPDSQGDVRIVRNLFDGVNQTRDVQHMWLAPIGSAAPNVVYVALRRPTAVSMIKIWNYSRTPERGVKEFEIMLDDLMIYKGELHASEPHVDPTTPSGESVLFFTNDRDIINRERAHVCCYAKADEEAVVLVNDRKWAGGRSPDAPPGATATAPMRPTTCIVDTL
eukprot:Rmarinus@m.24495